MSHQRQWMYHHSNNPLLHSIFRGRARTEENANIAISALEAIAYIIQAQGGNFSETVNALYAKIA